MICRIFYFEIMSLVTSASRQFNQEAGHGAEARRESSRRYRRHDGERLGQRDFYSMSDCQDGLSNMVEELQPEWHEVFVREGTIVRSPISIHCSKLDSKRGAGTRAAERR
jgi:hypothetical protein